MRNSLLLKTILCLTALAACLCGTSTTACAQFKEKAFSQTYNDDTTGRADTTDKLFSIKEYAGALAHKNTTRIGTMFAGSMICVGGYQIYEKKYWKLPIVYGTIGGLAGVGGYYQSRYNQSVKALDLYNSNKTAWETENPGLSYSELAPEIDTGAKNTAKWYFLGAGLAYWGTLMDGVIHFEPERKAHPGRATLYSLLCPGLGQAYNGEYWKIPLYYSLLLGGSYFLYTNQINYKRFQRIYIEASSDTAVDVPISAENAKYYRDVYRRYRDYSVLATVAFYLIQVIDANVFAYMGDFEVSEDLSLSIQPTVLAPGNAYALGQNAVGMKLGLTF